MIVPKIQYVSSLLKTCPFQANLKGRIVVLPPFIIKRHTPLKVYRQSDQKSTQKTTIFSRPKKFLSICVGRLWCEKRPNRRTHRMGYKLKQGSLVPDRCLKRL